ncbi:hypothetical protein PFISCL1PPCAC_11729, partial [Pristionchus fissidentatus]
IMIFLPLDVQEALLTAQRCLFVLSSILNLTSVICLYVETPPNQARIRNHIVFLQAIIILGGVHLDILFEPFVLCPEPGLYCLGLLCTMGVPLNISMAFLMLAIILTGVAIMDCCLLRHQTLIPATNRWKL